MDKTKTHNHKPLPENAKKVFHGNRFQVWQWEQEQFDGSVKTYESIKRSDTIIVFPIIDNKVVIIEEEQPHWGRKSDSIIAGGIDDGEDMFDGVKRELEEETGMVFKDFYLVHAEQRSIDIHSTFHVFIAKNLIGKKERSLDVGEKTEPKEVSFEELIQMVKQRKFFHKPFFIDEYIVQDKVDILFDMFRNPDKYSIL